VGEAEAGRVVAGVAEAGRVAMEEVEALGVGMVVRDSTATDATARAA
jgi:hypothetical protein